MRAAAACAFALAALAAGDGAAPSLRGGPDVAWQGAAAALPDAPRAADSDVRVGNASAAAQDAPQSLLAGTGWYQGGSDKMWGSGAGVEDITARNVAYYDQGMYEARARCGDSGCALITNPPGHRTFNRGFHISFVHFEIYGASLKSSLEGEVCGKAGWQSGGPCRGRAAYFQGFPGVFSEAMKAGGGYMEFASVIAWPAACGGNGTIVELAYGCSIEHQIRGDFDPNHR